MSDAPVLSIAVTVEASPAVLAAAAELAAALRAVAAWIGQPPEPPALAPAGPLLIVDHGAKVDYSMSSLPLKKDGIQRVNAGDYDGAVAWEVTQGPATIAAETPDGLAARLTLNDDAAEGDVIAVEATADVRHGPDSVDSTAHFTYEVVAADGPALTGAGFEVVDHAAPAA